MVLSTMGTVAFAEEADVIVLNAGTYTWESRFAGKTVVAADGEEVILDMTVVTKPGLGGADTSFEGITFEWGNAGHNGLQHSGNLTYTNCVINGQPFLYGESETFENCTFNQTDINQYNVWTYAAKEVKFIGCTFNSAGRCVLVYGDGGEAGSVEFEDTTLNASNAVDGKAAIEIDTSLMTGNATITVDENTIAIGFGAGSKSNNTLWNVKTDPAKKESSAVVSVADETVYAKVVDEEGTVGDIVASVSGAYYSSLQDALKATKDMDTAEVTIFAGEYSIDAFTLGTNVREYPFADNLSIVADGDVTIKLNSETKSYQNGVAYQYFVGGSWYVCGKSIAFDGINFVFEDTNTEDGQTMAEIQTYASESLSYTNCTFDNVSVSPWGDNSTGKTAAATIEGCTFSNIASRSAIHQSKALNLTVANNDFIDVVNGVHISGNELATLTVTSNDFDGIADGSAAIYFGNESWNGVWVGDYSNATITVTGNTSDAALVRNGNESLTVAHIDALSDETANTFESAFTGNSVKFVACIGNTNYVSLADAFAAAQEGEVITLLADATPTLTSPRAITKASVIDLNGKTLTLTEDDLCFGTTTFKNGNIVVAPSVKASTAVFWMLENQTLTFDNVDITATGVTGTYLIGTWDNDNKEKDVNINILNGTNIIIDNDTVSGLTAVIGLNGTDHSVTISDSNIDVNNIEGRFYLGCANGSVNVDNSAINLDGVKEGFYLRAGQKLDIAGTSNVNVKLNNTNGRYGINLTDATANYTVADTATVNASIYRAPAADGSNLADEVKLTFEPTDKQEVYNIYVETKDAEQTINRLSAVQVKFELDNPKMSYTLAPATDLGVTLTNDLDDEKAYVFNFNGEDAADATGVKLLIGTVTFGGYGGFNFKVDKNFNNKIKTAQTTDNIVEEYVPTPDAANEKQGTFDIVSSAITGAEVVEAKRDVKVVIDFNNDITAENDADYNDMTVTLTGSNGEEWIGYVGSAPTNDDPDDKVLYFENTAEKAEMTFNNVTAGYRYTVVVKGEGYRTARYSTNVDASDDALVLTFWNNAKADENNNPVLAYIEDGEARSLKDVTFLAGDIAQDNIIDKYDLAAVVSYFGFDNLKTTNPNYVKYDLNRDGKIDADDISYVLVSWGK